MEKQGLRIVFMGTPDFILPVLEALQAGPHALICVYTQPPRPKGRGGAVQKSPAHLWAADRGIAVRIPTDFKDTQDIEAFKALAADVAVVAAYGMLLPQAVLDAPRHGCLNIHPSLLPRWRGTSPVQFAIWKGDEETGVSVMKLVRKMDAGPVLAQARLAMPPRATYESLNPQLWEMSLPLLTGILDRLAQGEEMPGRPQPLDGVTYTKMFTKEDGRIDWSQRADAIDRQARALQPWPGVWTMLGDRVLKILETVPATKEAQETPGTVTDRQGHIACGGGTVLKLMRLQSAGARAMDFSAALNGGHLRPGDRFS